jgi:hypothetical protein
VFNRAARRMAAKAVAAAAGFNNLLNLMIEVLSEYSCTPGVVPPQSGSEAGAVKR